MDKNEAYSALSDLIFKGFLTMSVSLGGRLFVFKTINEKEFDLMRLYSGFPDEKNYLNNFNLYYSILSLVAIDGVNFLSKRSDYMMDLKRSFLSLPASLSKKLLSELNKLQIYSSQAIEYLEGFTYTNKSRNTWKMLSGGYPNKEEFTGIEGTSKIGLNILQQGWMIINNQLDKEERYNEKFSLSLMIASASNPKGTRRIRSQFDGQQKNISEKRDKLAREGIIKQRKSSEYGWSAPVDTAEELVAELNRQMSGYKDRHDKFIENHLKKMNEKAERKAREAEEKIKKYREKHGDKPSIVSESRPLTAEEMEKFNKIRPKTLIQVSGESGVNKKDQDRILKKLGAKVLTGRR